MTAKGKNKMSLLQKLLIITVTIVLVILLLAVCSVNVILAKNEQQTFMQKLPFANEIYFCPTLKAVANIELDQGGMIVVKKRTSYQEGDVVAVANNGKIFEPSRPLLIGEIKQNSGKLIAVRIGADEKNIAMVAPDTIFGTVEVRLNYVGNLYKSLVGFRGIIFFGLIPLLVGAVLIALLINPFRQTEKSLSLKGKFTSQKNGGIEVITAEIIRTTPPENPVENGGQQMQNRPRGIIETVEYINATTTVITRKEGFLDEAQPVKTRDEDECLKPLATAESSSDEKKLEDIAKRASEIDFGEPKTESDSQEESTADESHEVILDSEDQVVPSMVVAAVQAQVEREIFADVQASEREAQEFQSVQGAVSLPKKLPASEIVKLYRLSKQPQSAQKEASDAELFTMAKLYYDNDIENYTKNKANN